MVLKSYAEKDYSGELNLFKMEKETILKALSKTKDSSAVCQLLEISERELFIKLFKHSISVK